MEFKTIQDFRKNATEEDYQQLKDFIESQTLKTAAFPNETYNFSYSSATKVLKEKGYLGGQIPKESSGTSDFLITLDNEECISRSFTVQQNVLERLDRFAEKHWQYSKKAVFNQLLSEALERYGY